MGDWTNYFVVTAGGAAALTGLIFVSVSLNLKQILAGKHLPGRALGSLVLLSNILISGSLCLVPRQSTVMLGGELLAVDLLVWLFIIRLDIGMYRSVEPAYRRYYIQNIVFSQVAILPFIAGAGFFLLGSPDAFYWLIPGVTISFIKALTDSWVLLVEINR